jgi:hypothetical protein
MSTVRCLRMVMAIALATAALLPSDPALANGPQVGFQAGAVFPVASRTIRLLSERVTVRLGDPLAQGRAECLYQLVNLSDSLRSFQMAFVPYGFMSDRETYDHLHFAVRCLGKDVPVRFQKVDKEQWLPYVTDLWTDLPVWDLEINPRDTLDVGMRYDVYWSGDDGSGVWRVAYNARPASLWAGTVAEARVAFEFAEFTAALLRDGGPMGACRVELSPPGSVWVGSSLVWEFKNWEPDQDISIWVKTDGH